MLRFSEDSSPASVTAQVSVLDSQATKEKETVATTILLTTEAFENVLRFTPTSSQKIPVPIPSFNPQEVQQFLNHIALGLQDQAEVMLQENPTLVLARGDMNDLSRRNFESTKKVVKEVKKGFFFDKLTERTERQDVDPEIARLGNRGSRVFKGITAFQYALWALDAHMWTMLLKYLKQYPGATQEQMLAVESANWIAHGEHAGPHIQRLIQAMHTHIKNLEPWSADQSRNHWIYQVGGAQLLLPMHVINEYCHPERSFAPELGKTPDFNLDVALPRTRQFYSYLDNKQHDNVFDCPDSHGTLGATFGLVRGSSTCSDSSQYPCVGVVATYRLAARGAAWASGYVVDLRALTALLDTRLRQREQLLTELAKGIGYDPAPQVAGLRK